MGDPKHYWFHKNQHGIGLGWPDTRQGYAAYIFYFILVLTPLFIRPFLSLPAGYFKWVMLGNQIFWSIVLYIVVRKKGLFPSKPEKSPDDEDEYWFPKSETGIGWGFPETWQGILVYIAFFNGLFIPFYFRPLLGKYLVLALIPNHLFWLIFLIVMVIKHGEK